MAEYEQKMYDVESVPAGDSLIAGGSVEVAVVRITTPGEYERGQVLMSSGDSFVKATAGGIITADELAILSNRIVLEDGEEGEFWVYVSGRFNKQSLVYDDSIDIESLEVAMRRNCMFMR